MAVITPMQTFGPTEFAACSVLVVEPSAANRRLMRDLLRMLSVGCVEVCEDFAEGRLLLGAAERHVLFVDWSRATDALRVLATLRRAYNPYRFLPVVVMSGFSDPARLRQARDAGASEYLLKPFTIDIVRSRLRSALLAPRVFVQSDAYFGPDRRRRVAFAGPDRRRHKNCRAENRRTHPQPWQGWERRQGLPGHLPLERRGAPRY